ncbi:hypothetical protein MTR_0233s0050 [Medicago truncatula]|uniref:Uncharacterized protein n=1 Tax=Medicago truncatula TaxID=3880 RepID=A0A072TGK4_MEDTR|nr:hypothetical protein MTR_0233s0050 [Medicago truncatula]
MKFDLNFEGKLKSSTRRVKGMNLETNAVLKIMVRQVRKGRKEVGARCRNQVTVTVERLTPLSGGKVIDTPTNGSVTTSFSCAKCPVSFGSVDFELYLVCLLLKHMDVIFGIELGRRQLRLSEDVPLEI